MAKGGRNVVDRERCWTAHLASRDTRSLPALASQADRGTRSAETPRATSPLVIPRCCGRSAASRRLFRRQLGPSGNHLSQWKPSVPAPVLIPSAGAHCTPRSTSLRQAWTGTGGSVDRLALGIPYRCDAVDQIERDGSGTKPRWGPRRGGFPWLVDFGHGKAGGVRMKTSRWMMMPTRNPVAVAVSGHETSTNRIQSASVLQC